MEEIRFFSQLSRSPMKTGNMYDDFVSGIFQKYVWEISSTDFY